MNEMDRIGIRIRQRLRQEVWKHKRALLKFARTKSEADLQAVLDTENALYDAAEGLVRDMVSEAAGRIKEGS